MHWYLTVLKKYAVLDGRARRKEYWMFILYDIIVSLVIFVVGAVVGNAVSEPGTSFGLGSLLLLIYLLGTLAPKLSVTVRRLHDTNHSALWLLVGLIPLIGPLVMLVLTLKAGDQGENQYGPDPKAAPAE